MNKAVLMGRLTKDPELRYTNGNSTAVVSFTLAVNRKMKVEGQPDADFFNIVAWAKTAEFVQKYFVKGQQVALTGRLQTRNWEDIEKVKHYVTEIVAEEVFFADSKKDGAGQAQTQSAPPAQNNQPQGGYNAPSNPPPTNTTPQQEPQKKPWER